ncbi:hypothetical protein [Streptomyces soliscabiei]|uniref:hypothetical protein n=1 Tax=Streptomyces soliscabiei TaxID=588897 RepID=UPI0029A69B3E|nr:hypothetical protein [Streptomyces sp. NY05-11A]MDX2679337.1 hypothetical protein [Streptomyces sp. NY05-11A]
MVQEAVKHLSGSTGDGSLSRLAQVRSEFSVNPRLAWATTSTFREAHSLAVKPYPDQATLVPQPDSPAR